MDLLQGVLEHLIADVVVAVLLFIIGGAFWQRMRERITRAFIPRALRDAGLRTGYAKTRDALPIIIDAIRQTSSIWILSNRGEDWIGPDKADLTKCIEENRKQISNLHIILLHPEADWLKRWCETKGRNLGDTQQRFHSSHSSVESFMRSYNFSFRPRYHLDDPVWRFIMTDHKLFLSSYATPGEARDSPILEFDRSSPFYEASKRYFESLWRTASTWTTFPAVQFNDATPTKLSEVNNARV